LYFKKLWIAGLNPNVTKEANSANHVIFHTERCGPRQLSHDDEAIYNNLSGIVTLEKIDAKQPKD